MFVRRVIVLLVALCAWAGAGQAYVMEKDFNLLTEEYVSSHVAWCKPNAAGKVRALFIVPRGGAREVIELAQRLDLDYQYVLTLSTEELGWTSKSGPYAPAEGVSQEDMTLELNEKLKRDYDVIITGLINWDMFPRESLYTIMKKVHDGTGLVSCYHKFGRNELVTRLFAKPQVAYGPAALLHGVPWQALPVLDSMQAGEILELRQFSNGRMALFNYPGRPIFCCLTPVLPDTDLTSYRDVHYDYYQSMLLKAILWAAKKEPRTAVAEIGLGKATVERKSLPITPLQIKVTGPTAGMRAEVTVRDDNGRVFLKTVPALDNAGVRVTMPLLPAGRYFADAIIKNAETCVNWASSAFDVTTETYVATVTLDRPAAKPGETVTAEVTLSSAPPPGATLWLVATDSLGREMLRKSWPARERTSIPFQLVNPLAMSATVTVYLLEANPGKQPLAQANAANASTLLYVPLKRSRNNYAHAVWSAADQRNDHVRRLHFQQLQNCDVDMHTNAPTKVPGQTWLQQNNFDTIPYATRYSYDGKETVRKPCLTDPKFLSSHLEGLQNLGTELGPYGPRAYTLGDECFLARNGVDVCTSPTCVADLREWLKGVYPNVAALNASWGTSYKSLDEAEPITFAEARTANQPARWVDHRRHMEFVYARMMTRAEDAIRRGDPEAEVGFDGPFATDSQSGNDWSQLMQTFDMCNVYFHQPTQWEFLRSFAGDRPRKEGMLLGLWYGGYFEHRSEDEQRMWPWKGILNGFNSMWWYAVYHGTRYICPMDALTPSTTIYPSFRWATEEMKELRAGSGQALMNAERLHDGIGVHYSQSSLHASTWNGEWGRLDQVWQQLFGTLEDMGLQYVCRAYGEVERDGIDVKQYPAFFLPYSQAISAAEAAAFRRYVSEGGVLIADVRPGVMDQHGKAQSPGLLDDLFGIKRVAGKGPLKNQEGVVQGALLARNGPCELTGLDVDGDVQVTDGQALGSAGEMPLVIVKQTGKGRTVLLNYGFAAPYRSRADAQADAQWAVLYGALGLAEISPRYRVEAPDAKPLRRLETVRFQDGPIEYVGFLKYRLGSAEQTVAARVEAQGMRRHTYDLRTGQYLNEVAAWQSDFTPARAKLFARLPYKILGLKVAAAKASGQSQGQQAGAVANVTVGLQTTSKTPGPQYVQLIVTGPDGVVCRHYGQNLRTAQGQARAQVQFALNDPPGKWKLTARDVISSKTAETTIVLP